MTISGQEILKAPIIHQTTHKLVEMVTDLIIDEQSLQLAALAVTDQSVLLQLENISQITPEAIIVSDEAVFTPRWQVDQLQEAARAPQGLRGRRVFSYSGVYVGKISDLHFDPKSGRLVGMAFRDGHFHDRRNSETVLPAFLIETMDKRGAYISTETLQELEKAVFHQNGNQ